MMFLTLLAHVLSMSSVYYGMDPGNIGGTGAVFTADTALSGAFGSGTYSSCPTCTVPVIDPRGYLDFQDSTTSSGFVQANNVTLTGKSFTLTLRVYAKSYANYRQGFGWGNFEYKDTIYFQQSPTAGDISFGVWAGPSMGLEINTNTHTVLLLNTWTTFTLVFDDATKMMVYQNGALIGTYGPTNYPTGIGSRAQRFIGRSTFQSDPKWHGYIDLVWYNPRPLSGAEVRNLFMETERMSYASLYFQSANFLSYGVTQFGNPSFVGGYVSVNTGQSLVWNTTTATMGGNCTFFARTQRPAQAGVGQLVSLLAAGSQTTVSALAGNAISVSVNSGNSVSIQCTGYFPTSASSLDVAISFSATTGVATVYKNGVAASCSASNSMSVPNRSTYKVTLGPYVGSISQALFLTFAATESDAYWLTLSASLGTPTYAYEFSALTDLGKISVVGTVPNVANGLAYFNGTGNYYLATPNFITLPSSGFTLMTRVMWSPPGGTATIGRFSIFDLATGTTDSDDHIVIEMYSNSFYVQIGNAATTTTCSGASLTRDVWSMIILTVNDGNMMRLYVNNVLTCTFSNLVSVVTSPRTLYVGKSWRASSYWSGSVDYVVIYNQVYSFITMGSATLARESASIRCPIPILDSGQAFGTCAEGRLGSTCQLDCAVGYAATLSTVGRCQYINEYARWVNLSQTCIAVCPVQPYQNVQTSCSGPNGPNKEGATCIYTCSPGYTSSSQTLSFTQTCSSSSTWGGPVPDCVAVQCPTITIANSALDCGNCTRCYNANCSISCAQGTALVGASSVRCTQSGQWTPALPTCNTTSCPTAGSLAPKNGTVQCNNGATYGSVCSYACNSGFSLQGQSSATCAGLWSSPVPQCNLITCSPQLTPPVNGGLTCVPGLYGLANSLGSQCTFMCNLGFQVDFGSVSQSNPLVCGDGGWSSSTPVCSDTNECTTGQPCPQGSSCVNRVGGYDCGPYFLGNTTIKSNITQTRILSSTLGEWVYIPFITPTSAAVITQVQFLQKLGVASSFFVQVINATNKVLYALVPPGMGGYTIMMTYSMNGNTSTVTTADSSYFMFPSPVISPSTIRFYGDSTLQSIIIAPSDGGDLVSFNGSNFDPDPTMMTVTYGPAIDPTTFPCVLQVSLSTSTTITCLTALKGVGLNVFQIVTNSLVPPVTGTDVYRFLSPYVAQVTSVMCQTSGSGLGVVNCPTPGGYPIVVSGQWDPTVSLSITVASNPCPNTTAFTCDVELCNVTCTLPPGTGSSQAVVLNYKGIFGNPQYLVSYGKPQVTSIIGCTPTASPTAVQDCARQGGNILTIIGSNFGASGATAMVGSVQCTTFLQDPTTPHTLAYCTLPPGSGLGRAVQVFQASGQLSDPTSALHVDYLQCTAGSFQNGTQTACAQCTPGSFAQTSGQAACLPCDTGKFSLAGAYNCTACPQGTYQSQSGMSTCTQCDVGLFNGDFGAISCTPCDSGQFADVKGMTSCSPCAIGRVSIADSLMSTGPTTCVDCAAGTYVSTIGQFKCRDCDAGRYSSFNGSTDCQLCESGRFQPSSSSTVCTDCSVGMQTVSLGSTACTQCDVGTFWQSDPSNSCPPCPAGSISTTKGSLKCMDCGQGYYLPVKGRAQCLTCPAGTFQDGTGQTFCVSCPVGRFSGGGAAVGCEQCSLGYYAETAGRGACDPCNAGRYSSMNESSSCALCPLGRFSANGATECTDCQPGTYLPVAGAAQCSRCAPGRYVNSSGRTTCDSCEAGTFNRADAATACDDCDLGTFTQENGQPTCTSCPAGTYNNIWRSSSCTACPKSQYQSSIGSTLCLNCPQGTYGSIGGLTTCEPCAPGTYVNSSGVTKCGYCEAGRAQSAEGKLECVACSVGTYSGIGYVDCARCPIGQIAPTTGATMCQSCKGNTGCPSCVLAEASASGGSCLCPSQYYMTNSSLCVRCPVGTNCDVLGVTEATLDNYVADNWLKLNGLYQQCIVPNACKNNTCVFPRTGPLCSLCKHGYSLSGWAKACVVCTTKSGSLATTVGAMIGTVAVAGVLVYYLLFRNRIVEKGKIAMDAEERGGFLSSLAFAADGFEISYAFKILIRFFQVTSALASLSSVKSTNMPTLFIKFLGAFQFLLMDIVPWTSVSCLLPQNFFFTKLVIATILPVALIGVLAAMLLVVAWIRRKSLTSSTVRYLFVRLCIFATFALYPSISSVVLSLFPCMNIQGTYYLMADFSIQCYTPLWRKWSYYAIAMIIVYPVGVPLTYFLLLFTKRKQLYTPFGLVALGFLHESYTRDVWYFELVAMSEKLFMTSLLQFMSTDTQLPVAMGVTGFFLIIIVMIRPENSRRNWTLHMLSVVEVLVLIVFWHMQTKVSTAVTHLGAVDLALSLLFVGLAVVLIALLMINPTKITIFLGDLPQTNACFRFLRNLTTEEFYPRATITPHKSMRRTVSKWTN